jgi:MFS family permease
MATPASSVKPALGASSMEQTGFGVLGALSFSHFLNDMMQSLILAIYPLLKASFSLSFTQIGLITLTYQITASLLQPVVGIYTDRHPKPYSLSVGMGFTLLGLLLLAVAPSFEVVLCRRSGWHRLFHLSSRIIACGAHGVWRTARSRAIGVSGGWQRRLGGRPADRRLDHHPAWPAQHWLFLAGRVAGHDRAVLCG